MGRPLTFLVLGILVCSSLGLGAAIASPELRLNPVEAHGANTVDSPQTGGTGPANWPTYLYDVERTGANHFEKTITPANVSALERTLVDFLERVRFQRADSGERNGVFRFLERLRVCGECHGRDR